MGVSPVSLLPRLRCVVVVLPRSLSLSLSVWCVYLKTFNANNKHNSLCSIDYFAHHKFIISIFQNPERKKKLEQKKGKNFIYFFFIIL